MSLAYTLKKGRNMKIVIGGRLDGLNEYTKACRGNKFAGNEMKHKNQNVVVAEILARHLKPITKFPVALKINWYEPNKRRDIDNITFATKFIQDALVETGIIPDDSQKYINKVEHEVFEDKARPRIEIEVV